MSNGGVGHIDPEPLIVPSSHMRSDRRRPAVALLPQEEVLGHLILQAS